MRTYHDHELERHDRQAAVLAAQDVHTEVAVSVDPYAILLVHAGQLPGRVVRDTSRGREEEDAKHPAQVGEGKWQAEDAGADDRRHRVA